MTIINDCLAKGTMISTPSGDVSVERIAIGDYVLCDYKSNELARVRNVYTGMERRMIHVRTKKDRELLMTADHPVFTTEGVLCAKRLRNGMDVLTTDGHDWIEILEMRETDIMVYSIDLESDPSGGYMGMYANGIKVGDLRTQNILS